MDDQTLRKHYVLYVVGAIIFTVTLSAAVVVQRYASEMKDTVDKLRTLSGGSVRVRRATESAHESMAKIRREIPPSYLSMPVENVIFQAVDTVRDRAKNAEIVVESLQEKDNEMVLPVAVKGPLGDYGEFLRIVALLESLRFPFFSAGELIMSQDANKVPYYELRGSMRTPKPSETPRRESSPRRGS